MDCLDDNDVLALVSGALSNQEGLARRTELDAHLEGCASCRSLVSASKETAGPREAPKQLGRYSVLRPIGEGAMGVVYAAYDPQLQRRVALKLLHANAGAEAVPGGGDPAQRSRLLSEAQAMARLSHPNVIAVHDAGTVGEQVFVAMELVEGKTLAAWLRSAGPSWREILRVFILAGRGLAAAHAAGVVHRDFKPENVLVGNDGRVRVTDFGLARAEGRTASGQAAGELAAPLRAATQAGALIGSPPYMSPEQIRGEKADARADQFSFSVALYAALYGERPYAGENLRELLSEIEAGRVRPERSDASRGSPRARVPGRIRRVLLRGLSPRAADRYPSLEAMIAALELDPAVRWRRLGAAGSAIIIVASALFFLHRQSAREAEICRGAELKLQNVWDDSVRAKGKAGFAATKLSYADATWTLVAQALDRYTKEWVLARTDACEATAVRKQQSPELLDLRMACLDDRLRSLRAVTSVLQAADKEVVSRATQVASGLPAIASCSNEAVLRAPEAPPPELIPQINALRDRLAQVIVLGDAGKSPIRAAQELNAAAQKLGYAPLEAEALLALGRIEEQSGQVKDAQKTFIEATAAALRAKLDTLLADAWTEVLDIDLELEDVPAATSAAQQARAAESLVAASPRQHAQLLIGLAFFDRFSDKMEQSQRDCEQAVAILEGDKNPADSGLQIQVLGELGLAHAARGHWQEAIDVLRRAYDKAIPHYGPDHPISGEMEGALGAMLVQRDRIAEARPHLEHAVAVLESALGPDHPAVADALRDLATSFVREDPARTLALAQRATQILVARIGEDGTAQLHYLAGIALEQLGHLEQAKKELELAMAIDLRVSHNLDDAERMGAAASLACVLLEEGKQKAAQPILEHSLVVLLKTYGPDHTEIGEALYCAAQLALAERRLPEARKQTEESMRIARLNVPGDSSESILRELLLAEISIAEGKAAGTRAPLERIVALPESGPERHLFDRARARFLLAEALWSDPANRPRALQLAERARADYAARGPLPAARDRAELNRWLAARKK